MGVSLQNKVKYILDIGSSSICLLAVSNFAGKPRIVAEENVLYDGYIDGEFLSEDLNLTISTLLEQMRTKMRKPINSVIVGVPADFCICVCKRITRKYVTNHKITNNDIANMYETNFTFGDSEQYEVINYSPMQFVMEDNVKTISPVGKKTNSLVLDASYILAKKSFINILTSTLNEQGIKNVEFISTPLGQALFCEPVKEDNKPIAIIDVGHITTSVCVLKGEGLALLSSFSMGGGHISADIMQLLNLSFKDAELIKRKVILTIDSAKNDYYEVCSKGKLIKAPINITNQIVKSRMEMIAKVIKNILSIDDVFKGIDIYLTGDGITNFKGVKNIIKDETGLNVYEFKNPFDNSKEKYKTSKTGLAALANEII